MHLRWPPIPTECRLHIGSHLEQSLDELKWRNAFPWGVVGLIAKARHPIPHYSSFPQPHRLNSATLTH